MIKENILLDPLSNPSNNILVDIHSNDYIDYSQPFFKVPKNIIIISFSNINSGFSGNRKEKERLVNMLSTENWPSIFQIPFGRLYLPGDEIYNPYMSWDVKYPYYKIDKLSKSNQEIIVGSKDKDILRSKLIRGLSTISTSIIIIYMSTCDPHLTLYNYKIGDWNKLSSSIYEKRLRLNEISKEKYNNYFPNKHQLRSSGFDLFKDDFGRILKDDKKDYINFDLTKNKLFMEENSPHRICVSPCRRLTCHGECLKDDSIEEELDEYYKMPKFKGKCNAMSIKYENSSEMDTENLLEDINCEGIGYDAWSNDDYCLVEDDTSFNNLQQCIPATEEGYVGDSGLFFNYNNEKERDKWDTFLTTKPLPEYIR